MYHFHELNNNIEDVPMKFQDKYLTLLNNSSETSEDSDCDDDDDDNNIDQYQIEDYKFDSELIAIEMYELYQKRKEEILENQAKATNLKKNVESNNVQSDNLKPLLLKIVDSQNQKKNLLYNLIPGEILQPQPLMNNNTYPTPSSIAHSSVPNVNPSNCDKKNMLGLKRNHLLVNPKEFENDDSSPFDNVELQTIDDIKELNKVFGALNLSEEKNLNFQVPRNSPIQQQNQVDDTINANDVATAIATFSSVPVPTANNYHHGYPEMIQDLYPNYKTQNSTIDAHLYNSPHYSSPYHHSPTNILPENQNLISVNNMSVFNTQFYNSANIYSNYNQNIAYTLVPHLSTTFEMKRSSSEKKDFYEPFTSISNINSRSKSVSDLSKIPSCDLLNNKLFYNFYNNTPNDRSKTPPTKLPGANCIVNQTINSNKSINQQTKKLIQTDLYGSLTEKQRNFVDRLCQMGFQRDRVSRAVKHMDIDDDKKIFEYLLALQQLEDQGYDCYEVEIALHFNNYDKNKAENFLTILKQMCDFGFDKEKSIKALFKTNNDRDKAIELLLKLH